MPNHVTNEIRIEGTKERINELLSNIKDDAKNHEGTNTIDFKKVIPMPKDLEIESSSTQIRGLDYCLVILHPDGDYLEPRLTWDQYNTLIDKLNSTGSIRTYDEETIKKLFDNRDEIVFNVTEAQKSLGAKAIINTLKFGYPDWYYWSLANWGTKWNAYDYEAREDNMLVFHTAWSPAYPITYALSEQYPDLTFVHRGADEGEGYVFPIIEFKNGEANISQDETFDIDLWYEIQGFDKDDYDLDN